MGFIIAPFLSPFAFGFLVARAKYVNDLRCFLYDLTILFAFHTDLHDRAVPLVSWRWTYGTGSFYGAFVVFMIAFFMKETWVSGYYLFALLLTPILYTILLPYRMYDRTLPNPRPIARPPSRLRYRIESLIGVTGWRMARFRPPWRAVVLACASLAWRPHILSILIFEARTAAFLDGTMVLHFRY